MSWTFDIMPFNNLILQKFSLLFFSTDRHVEKESLAEYIAKKREMFLVQVCDFFLFSYYVGNKN